MTELCIHSPYDGAHLETLELDDAPALESKLARLGSVMTRRAWLPKFERYSILERATALIEQRTESLARLAASEGGKPLLDSRVEIVRAADGLRAACAALRQDRGHEVPMGLTPASTGRFAHTHHEPVGVVGAISAFNHPFNLAVHQLVPAVATGCPVLIKPASSTPLSCRALLGILREAGLPEEQAEMTLLPADLSEKFAGDSRLGFLSFIGSAAVGWKLKKLLAPGVTCALEHGGVAPLLLHETADLDAAARGIVKGGFYHAGQVCVSVQRVYVPRSQLQALLDRLVPAVRTLRVGDPLDERTEVGPLINEREVPRVASWVDEAVAAGVPMLCGGKPLGETSYEPTLLLDPPSEAHVSCEEVFGPVVCIYPFDSWDDAIERANAVDSCFQAALFTSDLDVALSGARRLRGTTVLINEHTAFRTDWMPFGGRGRSGLGLGGIDQSMRDMTAERMIVFRSSAL